MGSRVVVFLANVSAEVFDHRPTHRTSLRPAHRPAKWPVPRPMLPGPKWRPWRSIALPLVLFPSKPGVSFPSHQTYTC